MKTKTIILIVLPAVLVLSSYRYGEDIITKLGLDHANAQNHILANFTGGFGNSFGEDAFFRLPYAKLLPSVIAGDKVGSAKELLAYIKMYCNSAEFVEAYNKKRVGSKPTSEPPRMDEETLENMRKSNKEMALQLAEMKKDPKQNAQVIPIYENMLSEQNKLQAEWEDPTPNMTKWKREFPENPAIAVKNRLEDYLKLVSTVDFNAQLTAPDKYKIKKFVNSDYEEKSGEWKACFRAGKEVNDAVTTSVKDWLKGEIISATKVSMPKEAQTKSDPVDKVSADNTSENETPAVESQPVKTKKSLLGKLKDKAKTIIE